MGVFEFEKFAKGTMVSCDFEGRERKCEGWEVRCQGVGVFDVC